MHHLEAPPLFITGVLNNRICGRSDTILLYLRNLPAKVSKIKLTQPPELHLALVGEFGRRTSGFLCLFGKVLIARAKTRE